MHSPMPWRRSGVCTVIMATSGRRRNRHGSGNQSAKVVSPASVSACVTGASSAQLGPLSLLSFGIAPCLTESEVFSIGATQKIRTSKRGTPTKLSGTCALCRTEAEGRRRLLSNDLLPCLRCGVACSWVDGFRDSCGAESAPPLLRMDARHRMCVCVALTLHRLRR